MKHNMPYVRHIGTLCNERGGRISSSLICDGFSKSLHKTAYDILTGFRDTKMYIPSLCICIYKYIDP